MRTTLILAGLIVVPWLAVAQTDSENVKKYWKLRSRFKEQFVKIGPGQGESLPASVLKPCECIDDLDADIDGNGWGASCYGEMHWGDGMIRHGHYLGLLATEYRLLKNEGKDVKGVLSELFYALYAIDRNDYGAENNQETFYLADFQPSINGFYNREDIPQGFAKLNWGSDPMLMRGVNAASYYNNYASDDDENEGAITRFNDYQNTPSLDQLTSLMVGFSLIHKLVDNEFISPTGEGGVYIRDYSAGIVDRLIRDIADHNWFMIDVNGWPVNNGGGDVVLAAFPLLAAAERITGNTYNENWKRRFIPYAAMQECITGYGTHEVSQENQQAACDKIQLNALLLQAAGPGVGMPGLMIEYNTSFTSLQNGVPAGSNNNRDNSKFQDWQSNGPLHGTTDFSIGIWLDKVPTEMPGANVSGKWEYILGNLAPPEWRLIQSWMGPITDNYDEHWIKDYNMTIMFNLGVASGYWSKGIAALWGNSTGNKQLELINAILRDESPMNSRAHYKSYLDDLTIFGPYSFEGVSWPEPHSEFSYHADGWASEYRWTHPSESMGPSGKRGIFSGMDYMLYHNLVQLAFPSEAVAMDEVDFCTCYTAPQEPTFGVDTPEEAQALQNLNQKLAFLGECQSDVLAEVNNEVYGSFTVGPKFPAYTMYGIQTTRYQTTDAVVKNGGLLTVNNRLVMCNSTITIEPSAEMVINGEVDLKSATSKLDVYGTLRIKDNGQMDLAALTKIILRGGAKLIIEDDVDMELIGASIDYYDGAEIITTGSNSKIHFNPGGIVLMDDADFVINTATAPQMVKFIFSGNSSIKTVDGKSGTFNLKGRWKGDPFIELTPNAILWVMDDGLPGNGETHLKIEDCAVQFSENSELRVHERLFVKNVEMYADKENKGLNITDYNNLYDSDFSNVPIVAPLNIENKSNLNVTRCTFERTIGNTYVAGDQNRALVSVDGRAVRAVLCDFSTNFGNCIASKNGTYYSHINECTFTRNLNIPNTAFGQNPIGIRDSSNTECIVMKSTFTNLLHGVRKYYGKATLKCNTFSGMKANNVSMSNSILNMSVDYNGGYNDLGKPEDHTYSPKNNVYLYNSDIQIDKGYNKFGELVGGGERYITGYVPFPCQPNSDCAIPAKRNQWGNTLTAPAQNRFNVDGNNWEQFQFTATATYAFPLCGSQDPDPGPVDPGGGLDGKALGEKQAWVFPVISTSLGEQPLDFVVRTAMSKMTAYTERGGNDLEALALLDEVFTSGVDLESAGLRNYLFQAAVIMKTALEGAYDKEQISVIDNAGGFEKYTQMYVDAMNMLTETGITEYSYKQAFMLELNKMQLFRLLDMPQVAIRLLTELEYCGLDTMEQHIVNDWKDRVQQDAFVKRTGFASIDSTFTPVRTGYAKGSANGETNFTFGVVIQSPYDMEAPYCNWRANKGAFEDNPVVVYPNPAKESFQIDTDIKSFGGAATIKLETIDGRLVLEQQATDKNRDSFTVQVRGLSPGTYMVRLIGVNGHSATTKVVVN